MIAWALTVVLILVGHYPTGQPVYMTGHLVGEVVDSVEFDNLIRSRNAQRLALLRAEREVVAGPVTPASPTTTTAPPRPIEWRPSVERWRGLVSQHFRPGDIDHAMAIIRCESVGDPDVVNPSSGTAGLFQHRPEYWVARSSAAGWAGSNVFDPEANVAVAAWLVHEDGWWHWSGRAWNIYGCEEWACDQGVCR